MSEILSKAERRSFLRSLHERHPAFRTAVREDARVTADQRGERCDFRSRWDTIFQVLRLMWVSDAFAAHVAYRLRTTLWRRRIPVLPFLLHRFCMRNAQLSVGPGVLMHPGVYIVHGQLVMDGLVEVGAGSVLSPWVTLGLRSGDVQGPTLGEAVSIGTGAKVIGPVTIGARAMIGANAVVVDDIPEAATAVGMPARVVDRG